MSKDTSKTPKKRLRHAINGLRLSAKIEGETYREEFVRMAIEAIADHLSARERGHDDT